MSANIRALSLSQYLISGLRLALILSHTLLTCIVLAFIPRSSERARVTLLRGWGRGLTWLMGVKVTQEGAPPQEGMIVIANHTSYADIPILMGIRACAFLAKSEVASWPLIGWGAQLAGTVFVDRSSPESRASSRAELKRRVEQGTTILVFSEGTTTPRGEIHPLKPGMFHEAASAQIPIQVVSLEYQEADAAWVGDDPLWPNFVRVYGRPHTGVRVCYRQELIRGEEGLEMAQEAERWLKAEAQRASELFVA